MAFGKMLRTLRKTETDLQLLKGNAPELIKTGALLLLVGRKEF